MPSYEGYGAPNHRETCGVGQYGCPNVRLKLHWEQDKILKMGEGKPED